VELEEWAQLVFFLLEWEVDLKGWADLDLELEDLPLEVSYREWELDWDWVDLALVLAAEWDRSDLEAE
jgi:hypothetical protein